MPRSTKRSRRPPSPKAWLREAASGWAERRKNLLSTCAERRRDWAGSSRPWASNRNNSIQAALRETEEFLYAKVGNQSYHRTSLARSGWPSRAVVSDEADQIRDFV